MKLIGIIVGVAGAILVVWHSVNVVMGRDQDGSGFGIYGQRLNAAGAKVGGEFQVNQSRA